MVSKCVKAGSGTLPFLGCAWVPASSLLEASQLRHLADCLCNDLAPLYFQLVASKTASKDPTLSERFQKVSARSVTLPI